MKRTLQALISLSLLLLIVACTPVIRKDLMDMSVLNPSLADMKSDPAHFRGNSFVLGGIIVNTKVTAEGSLIEAIYVTVDTRGYLKDMDMSMGRFLALFPKESGILDPVIFRSNRRITFAGEFAGLRKGRIDEMEYSYPFFRIRELYLWEEPEPYLSSPPYYEPYPYFRGYPYWWDPYWNRPLWHRRHAPPYRW
jgi:outer membrane lipoprotein